MSVAVQITTNEVTEALSATRVGVLVEFQGRAWGGRKKSNKAARDAAYASNANAASVSAWVDTTAGDKLASDLKNCVASARNTFYRFTMPWSTVGADQEGQRRKGARLMPNVLWQRFLPAMGEHQEKLKGLLDQFDQHYPKLVQDAQSQLGDLFNPSDYPDPRTIRARYEVSFQFNPVPDERGFDGVPPGIAEHLVKSLNKRLKECLDNGMADVRERLLARVKHAQERLSDADTMKSTHGTFVQNAKEDVVLLRGLNVTNDPRLNEVLDDIQRGLCGYTVEQLKASESARVKAKDSMDSIMKKMKEVGLT